MVRIMGLFDGIDKAEVFERGRFFPPGFRGVVRVKRTISKETRASGIGFIVEFEVVRVDYPGKGYNPGDADNNVTKHELSPVLVGEKRTWFQKMSDKDVAFPAVLAWAAGLAGYASHEKDAIESCVAPGLGKDLNHATDNPAENGFTDLCVALATSDKKTKKGNDFTVHEWIPYEEVGS
jgi:hypothetical protein